MEGQKGPSPQLFITSPVELKDENDERYERCYSLVRELTDGVSEKDGHDALNTTAARGTQTHEDVSVGLLVTILSNAETAATKFRDLTLTNRDGFAVVVSQLQYLIVEKYQRLLDSARQQLVWTLRQLIRNSVGGTDGLCWNLMRQIVGGDVTPKNIWLTESILDIYLENRSWLEKHQFLTASVVYCYLRVIEDHFAPHLQALRDKEAAFVVSLLRERFADCMLIGRDLVRLLQHVARVPGIEGLWRDLLHNPTVLLPNFGGLLQLMQSRTSRRFLLCRLTPDMEKKIVFITSHVRFGAQKRYQDWFQKQYLSTTESQSLRCDLIRFIVGVIHPTNELLSSDIIPRWAVIGWLLTTCTSQVAIANAKLALFYDWLFYDAEKDNIMNIEPAVLVMHHSLRPHPAITATLLDFMCRIIPTFYPTLSDRVSQGMFTALRQIIKMRVLPSLEPLFLNAKLDKDLRKMLKERFSEFCAGGGDVVLKSEDADIKSEDGDGGCGGADRSSITSAAVDDMARLLGCGPSKAEDEPAFSDDDDEMLPSSAHAQAGSSAAAVNSTLAAASATAAATTAAPPLQSLPSPSAGVADAAGSGSIVSVPIAHAAAVPAPAQLPPAPVVVDPTPPPPPQQLRAATAGHQLSASGKQLFGEEYTEAWETMLAPLRKQLDRLRHETDTELRCEAMERICQIVGEDDLSEDETSAMAICLVANCNGTLHSNIYPSQVELSDETLEDSVGQPLFVLFRTLCNLPEEDASRQTLTSLLAEMSYQADRLAYFLLYYIHVRTYREEKDAKDQMFSVYKEFCHSRDSNKELSVCLVDDLRLCQEEEQSLLVWLVPALYAHLTGPCLGNVDLMQLVVSCLDSSQLLQLISHIVKSDLIMFRKDSFLKILNASLEWETFEQMCVWQLIEAHELTLDYIIPLLTRLQCGQHAEATSAVLLMLKREEPCMELIRPLLQRTVSDVGGDLFVCSVLRYWVGEYEEQTAELIANLINRTSLTPNKRRRNSPRSNLPTTEQILAHLDQLRLALRSPSQFWSIDEVQTALSVAQSGSNEQQRKRFADLFALLDVEDESTSRTRRGRKAAARGRASTKTIQKTETTDSDESSEDEHVKKPARKRRKNNQLNSDSE